MLEPIKHKEVLQIRLSRYPEFLPAATVSVYLVDGLLIDTGPAHTAEELVRFLENQAVTLAINTHHHEDHIAANRLLQERFGLEIFAPPLSVEKINQPPHLFPYQEEVWGYPLPSQVKALGREVRTERFRFQVIPTPGHDRDHICLHEPDRGWVFSGDLYIGSRPMVCRPMDDQWQILADLRRIRALQPQLLFPAPGRVLTHPVAKLDQVIAHLESLGEKILSLHRRGHSIPEILKEIVGQEDPLASMTQGQFSSENMIRSFLTGASPKA